MENATKAKADCFLEVITNWRYWMVAGFVGISICLAYFLSIDFLSNIAMKSDVMIMWEWEKIFLESRTYVMICLFLLLLLFLKKITHLDFKVDCHLCGREFNEKEVWIWEREDGKSIIVCQSCEEKARTMGFFPRVKCI